MAETFPYYAEDGFIMGNAFCCGWKAVEYYGLYRETNTMPSQWNEHLKRHKPVAVFITSQWRTPVKENGKLWYGCDTTFRHSEN